MYYHNQLILPLFGSPLVGLGESPVVGGGMWPLIIGGGSMWALIIDGAFLTPVLSWLNAADLHTIHKQVWQVHDMLLWDFLVPTSKRKSS